MPRDFIKTQAVKDHIADVQKLRSTADAVELLVVGFNKALEKAIAESAALAKKDNRSTIMEPDVVAALEKTIGRTHLTWSEAAQEVIRQEPTALGQIAKSIRDWIASQGDIRPARGLRPAAVRPVKRP